jgi:dienelactone hydrolase
MLGFSMGGAVSVSCADDPRVRDIIGLAPWFPEELPLPDLKGARVQIIHGSIDGWIPGVPGVRPSHSRGAIGRLRGAGAEVSYRLIRGAVHGLAVRPGSRLVTLPRARAWEMAVEHALQGAGAGGDQR